MSLRGLAGALLAIDVDGTLLRSDGSLAGRTVDALTRARDAGAVLSLATGRDLDAVRDLLTELHPVQYSLCVNGTEIVDREGRVLHAEVLDRTAAAAAVQALRLAVPGVAIGVGVDGTLVGESGIAELLPDGVGHVAVVDDALDALAADMRDLVVFHPDYAHDVHALHDHCVRALAELDLDVAYSGLPMIEVVPPGAGKDTGAAWLADHLGIDHGRVVAFGDGLNDLSMLRWAGVGVAMGQASAVVLEAADEVTESNDADGLARWIETRL